MKKFKILEELPKGDLETQSEQMLLEKCAGGLAWCEVAIDFQFFQNTVSLNYNKGRHNKMRYACMLIVSPVTRLCLLWDCIYSTYLMLVPELSDWIKGINLDLMPIGKMGKLELSIHHEITNLRKYTNS